MNIDIDKIWPGTIKNFLFKRDEMLNAIWGLPQLSGNSGKLSSAKNALTKKNEIL
jgi:hypothetical protein